MKQTLLLVIASGLLLLFGCSDPTQITADELSLALNINTFVISLPDDLTESDILTLEVVGKDGVVDSTDIDCSLEDIKYLKVFMNNKNRKAPLFSFATKTDGSSERGLNLGKTEVGAWQNDRIIQLGEYFIFCGVDGRCSASQDLYRDNLGIRVNVKSR